MTDDDYAPLTTAFEFQRTTIEQSREAFERLIEFQLQLSEAAISGTEVTSDLYKQGIEMNRQALHNYLDAVEATLPRSGDAIVQIRDTIDEQFDQLEEQQQKALSMAEENIGDAGKSSEAYLDALDDHGTDVIEEIAAAANEFDISAIGFTPRSGGRIREFLGGDLAYRLITEGHHPVVVSPKGEMNNP